jgi:arabinoxylan arabinofuranohydrolase
MIEIDGVPQVMDPPFLFEDSGINKIGDTYYYTYCTNWVDRKNSTDKDKMPIAVIGYMTSKNPLGPFEYKGYTLENPDTYFGASGNNHHWIFEFKNKWYIAYHTQTLENTVGFKEGGYRALFIDNFNVNADGSLPIQKGTKEGVAQVCYFDASVDVPAATFASCRNVVVTDSQTLCPVKNGAYICVKGVDFSKGFKEIEFTFANGKLAKGEITVKVDGFGGNGTEIASVKLNKKSTKEADLNLSEIQSGVHDLYFVFSGYCELKSWKIK